MGSQMDDMKGRLKQAIGKITDDDEMEREGSTDRAGGKVKKAAEKTGDAVENGVDAVKDRLRRNT